MKLIEDLGMRSVGNQGMKYLFGVYECPVCSIHFECRTSNVISGNTTKCKNCANKIRNAIRSNKAAMDFVRKAISIHGDKCDYTAVDYINNHTKVVIGCNICYSTFKQTPKGHLKGNGCPHCAEYGFSQSKPAIVYYIKITHNNTIAYKIGITNRSVQERFNSTDLAKIQVIKTWDYLIGTEAYDHEQQILKQYKDYKYTGEPLLRSGNTELFITDILELE